MTKRCPDCRYKMEEHGIIDDNDVYYCDVCGVYRSYPLEVEEPLFAVETKGACPCGGNCACKRAETSKLKRDSCCCGATKSKPCACMKQGIMKCSMNKPQCPCYQDLEKKGAESFAADEPEWDTDGVMVLYSDFKEGNGYTILQVYEDTMALYPNITKKEAKKRYLQNMRINVRKMADTHYLDLLLKEQGFAEDTGYGFQVDVIFDTLRNYNNAPSLQLLVLGKPKVTKQEALRQIKKRIKLSTYPHHSQEEDDYDAEGDFVGWDNVRLRPCVKCNATGLLKLDEPYFPVGSIHPRYYIDCDECLNGVYEDTWVPHSDKDYRPFEAEGDEENWTPCYYCDTQIGEGEIFYGYKGRTGGPTRCEAFCDEECKRDAGYGDTCCWRIAEEQKCDCGEPIRKLSHDEKAIMIYEAIQQNLNNPDAVRFYYELFYGEPPADDYEGDMALEVIEGVQQNLNGKEFVDYMYGEMYGAESFRADEDCYHYHYDITDSSRGPTWVDFNVKCKDCGIDGFATFYLNEEDETEDGDIEWYDAESFNAEDEVEAGKYLITWKDGKKGVTFDFEGGDAYHFDDEWTDRFWDASNPQVTEAPARKRGWFGAEERACSVCGEFGEDRIDAEECEFCDTFAHTKCMSKEGWEIITEDDVAPSWSCPSCFAESNAEDFASVVIAPVKPEGPVEKAMMNHYLMVEGMLQHALMTLDNQLALGIISEREAERKLHQILEDASRLKGFGAESFSADSNELSEERTDLAHQRTNLAWVRTGLAVVAFGAAMWAIRRR